MASSWRLWKLGRRSARLRERLYNNDVVVRRQLFVDLVEALQVAASTRIRIPHGPSGSLLIDPLHGAEATCTRIRRGCNEDAEQLRPLGKRTRAGVRDDDRVPTRSRLLDRLANQCPHLGAGHL